MKASSDAGSLHVDVHVGTGQVRPRSRRPADAVVEPSPAGSPCGEDPPIDVRSASGGTCRNRAGRRIPACLHDRSSPAAHDRQGRGGRGCQAADVVRHERRCGAVRAARSRGGGGRGHCAADLLSRARRPWPRHRECLGGRARRRVRPRRDSERSRRSGGQCEPGTGGDAPARAWHSGGAAARGAPAPGAPRRA